MSRHRHAKIAFLSFDWDYEIMSQYYDGMASYVREVEGLQVVVISAFGHYHKRFEADEGTFKVFDICDLSRYDGLVVQGNRTWSPALRQPVVDEARALGMPVVSINYDLEGAHSVGTDNYDAMYGLVGTVLDDQVCTRPAFVNGLATSVEAQARVRGYYDACVERGIADARLYQASWQLEDGIALAHQLLDDRDDLPDVLFCCNDDLAVGIQQTLRDAGVRIPEDVMVTGFDNREISTSVFPRITTVDRDYYGIGRTALQVIERLIAGEEVPREVYSPARYELRESSGYHDEGDAVEEGDLYSLGNTLKRFYEVLNDFQVTVYQADSLERIIGVCEEFAHELRCANVYMTINDAYLHLERGQEADAYHPVSHLMGHYGPADLGACDGRHIYESFSTYDVLPREVMAGGGFYVAYPLRRGSTCIGTLVTDGLSPVMRYGFLTFCLTLLSAGILSVRTMELLRDANAQLDNLYVHDELTGLFNRFGLERFGTGTYEGLLADSGEARLTFVDVDNMKGINDRLGHEEGDNALRDTADVIRHGTLGESAFAMRYGGDEFLIIGGRDLIPKLEDALMLLKGNVARPYDLSLSMGTVRVRAADNLSVSEAIRKADDRMYQIKRQRRVRRG